MVRDFRDPPRRETEPLIVAAREKVDEVKRSLCVPCTIERLTEAIAELQAAQGLLCEARIKRKAGA